MGCFFLNLYKEADMNQNVIRMFSRKKLKHNSSKNSHLWTMLEDLSKCEKPFFTKNTSRKIAKNISIHFADDSERARKVVKRSNHRMTGKQPSVMNERMIHWESDYERKAFQLLEASPFVAAYREQPATFKYHNGDGVMHTHFPDIFVTLVNGMRLFIEVKPSRAKNDQDLTDRENLLKELLSVKGFKYIQIYPDQLESFHYQANAQFMIWHKKKPAPYPVKMKIKKLLLTESSTSLASLISLVKHTSARSWIFALIMEGVITCDLSMPLVDNTIIFMKNK